MMSFSTIKPYLSFFHPMVMWILLAVAVYAMYLGVQVRRMRLGDSNLKKELVKGRFAIRHHQVGSVLLGVMAMGAIGGMTMAYLNTGNILINPHLFAGLGMVGLISTSVALVPFMQKHDWVRNIHIALNVVMMGLFSWQAVTGMQIVQKILSNMSATASAG
jgi:hypothetical protein